MPPRLAAVVLPVGLLGLAVAAAAASTFAVADLATLAGIAGLLAASTLAERFPVPLDGIDTGGVSLGFVFCTAAIVLYGWEAGVIVGLAAPIMHTLEHRPPIRAFYNASMLAIAAVAAGIAIEPLRGHDAALVFAQVLVAALAHFGVNLLLISLVVSVSSRKPFAQVVRTSVTVSAIPFALMASAALMLVILWQRSPFLSAALVGPLLAIALYQRSTSRALRAMRLALTDPLTGLGNRRALANDLERLLPGASDSEPLVLALFDLDGFKHYNDTFGHPAGDELLPRLGRNLARTLEGRARAYRMGGDEFCALLRADDDARLRSAISIAALSLCETGPDFDVRASWGTAALPVEASTADAALQLADQRMYAHKRGDAAITTLEHDLWSAV